MTRRRTDTPVALTIAGSDSGGGAGIQADLKTFAALGVFGTSAVTCLTAQNPSGVHAITPTPRGFVASQIDAVCSAFPVAAAKTGMLFSTQIIRETISAITKAKLCHLVVDPVARATSGSSLLKPSAEKVLINELIPLATVLTPNIPEAEMILAGRIRDVDDQADAARAISAGYEISCLLKGGHMPGQTMVDILCHQGRIYRVEARKISTTHTHGTGCTLSAAMTAFLAGGMTVPAAFRRACGFVREALRHPFKTGRYAPLGIRAEAAR